MRQAWYTSLGMSVPVVQAALGGGISTAELAVAVSRAGGLGTIGLMPEKTFAEHIQRTADALDGRPFAANLLMPLLRRGHVRAVLDNDVPVVSVFFGHDPALLGSLKAAGRYVVYQVGSAEEADRVLADGADALIVQGVEAGGHVAATEPLAELLPRVRAAHPDVPLLAAGGIYDAATARRARALGADGVSVGTRFLLTPESNAHDAYKSRLLAADETLLTDLFAFGWHAPHRVAPNRATERWCGADRRSPSWLARFNALSERPGRLLPLGVAARLTGLLHPRWPIFSPFPLHREMPPRLEVAPLYAGGGVSEMHNLRPAGEVVSELATAFE